MISVLENWIGTRNSEIPKNPTCGTRRRAPKKATKLAVGLRYFGRIRLSTHMNGFIDIFPFSSFSTDKTIAQLRVWEPGVECKKQLNFTSEDNIKAINYTKPCFLYTLKCLLPVYSNAINKSERYWNRWAIYVCVVCVVPRINDPQSLDVLCFECKPMHIDGLKIEWKAEKTRKKRCQQQTSHYGVMMPAVEASDETRKLKHWWMQKSNGMCLICRYYEIQWMQTCRLWNWRGWFVWIRRLPRFFMGYKRISQWSRAFFHDVSTAFFPIYPVA